VNKIFHIGSTFKAFDEGDDLHIAGMASTNGTDRVGDIIETEAWTKGGLDNFLNNPVILFNHDYNQPIGRAVQLGTNDNGLQLKAKIAKSAGHVGELIKEGVLGAFSVGFRVKDAEYMTETDGYKIKDAELLEVSVVTVPANQAATFSLAKSFDSENEYEEFKKSFKLNDSEEKHVLNVRETEDKVTVEFEKHSEEESMPKDLSQVEVQEKTMSDIDIDAIVAAAVEKTAAAMAMKEAERKAEEQAKMEAEQKAADETAAQKASEEARIVTAVQSGTEKLLADVEAKMNEKDADYSRIIGELKEELTQKSEEIQKINESKRYFADRGQKSVSDQEMVDAYILGAVTRKGITGTKYGASIFEKATNDQGGVRVPGHDSAFEEFEGTVSTAIERDVELELVIDPLFRKIQMTSATMAIPTLPDAGYAEWAGNNATGGAGGSFAKGNLEARGAASPGANDGIDMGSKILTVNRLISRSYLANEVEEDTILPILPLIRESMVRAHARAIEHALLQGGAAGEVNPNSANGLIKMAVDASKVLDSGSAGSSPAVAASADALLNMRQAMGKYGRRPSDVIYLISLDAYYDLLDDPDFQTINEVGDQRATRVTGEIANVYGSPVLVCDEFASGKTQAAHWGVAVNTRNFVVPVLRGVTVESDYDVANQHRVLVATQRRGFHCLFGTSNPGDGGQVVAHAW
jgi:HK97 family phage prohead protease/HK97 family phage major capsid protein